MKNKKTMISSKFYKMLVPETLQMAVAIPLLLINTLVAGIFLYEDAVSAITVVTPIYSLAISITIIVTYGVPIQYFYEMGAMNRDGAKKIFGLGLELAVGTGILLFLVSDIVGNWYLKSLLLPDSIRVLALDYFFWMKYVFLALPIAIYINEMIVADGDEFLGTISNASMIIVNAVASIMLVKPFGIAGVSLGLLAGTIICIVICLFHFKKDSNSLEFKWHFSLKTVLKIMRYSFADAASSLFLSISIIVSEQIVTRTVGLEYLNLVTIVAITNEVENIFDGIGATIEPFLGVYLSEGNKEGTEYVMKLAKKLAIIEGLVTTAIVFIIAPIIPSLNGYAVDETTGLTILAIRLMCLSFASASLVFLFSSYYVVRGKMILPATMCFLNVLAFPTIGLLVGVLTFGEVGMVIGYALCCILSWPIQSLLLKAKYGKNNLLNLDNDLEMKDCVNIRFDIVDTQISEASIQVGKEIEKRGFSKKTMYYGSLVVEEIFNSVKENNPDNQCMGEVSIVFDDKINVITRDNGKIYDLMADELNTRSISNYVLAMLVKERTESRDYLVTIGYNKNVFLLENME